MTQKFRKKPVEVKAVQWLGNNRNEINDFFGLKNTAGKATHAFTAEDEKVCIKTLEGVMTANKNDWIIKGVKGEFYPIKDDIFRETYEPVDR